MQGAGLQTVGDGGEILMSGGLETAYDINHKDLGHSVLIARQSDPPISNLSQSVCYKITYW